MDLCRPVRLTQTTSLVHELVRGKEVKSPQCRAWLCSITNMFKQHSSSKLITNSWKSSDLYYQLGLPPTKTSGDIWAGHLTKISSKTHSKFDETSTAQRLHRATRLSFQLPHSMNELHLPTFYLLILLFMLQDTATLANYLLHLGFIFSVFTIYFIFDVWFVIHVVCS